MSCFNSRLVRPVIFATIGLALTMNFGCKGNAGKTASAGGSEATVRSGLQKFNPTGASVCLQQMIKNPAGPLHLVFAESFSDRKSTLVEADVTSATVTYTRRETSAGQTSASTKKLKTGELSEMELDFDIMGPVPWHGELVAGQDAARPQGTEAINGYDARKFAIDTANEPAAQKETFESLMAVKNYTIVGNAWVANDSGCLVKYSIDFEKDGKDGSVEKTHFEGNVARK